MDNTNVAHNRDQSSMSGRVLNEVTAQEDLAVLINRLSVAAVSHWWKLIGDEPNCLCRFLDMPWEDLRSILRKCRVLYGENDSFRTIKFEELMGRIGCEWSLYRPSHKIDQFLRLGDQNTPDAVHVPKDMYSGGLLKQWPVSGVHMPNIRTKGCKRLANNLVSLCVDPATSSHMEPEYEEGSSLKTNNGTMTIYVNDLVETIKKEIMEASTKGNAYTFTHRTRRMIRKTCVRAIKGSVRAFVDTWVEHIGETKEGVEYAGEIVQSTPATVKATATASGNGNININNTQTFVTPPAADSREEEDDDERDIDIVLSTLKEETILQNLLHKRLVNNNRVFTLEHRNGRKLRVIIPPDSQTSKGFMEDAKKSRWVTEMLCNQLQIEGMLLYLATNEKAIYIRVAEQKKIRITSEALDTPQTLALGHLTGINDTQMSKLRSFLRHVGNAELKLTKTEVLRIDRDVGLSPTAMPTATFDTYTFEWSATGTSNEKKLPETCTFWNSDLMVEVAAEIDLLHHSQFLDKPDMRTMDSLDYYAPGFDNVPGIVVLFGGDHGAGACPCSLKLNLSSPEERKERGELNYRCPTIQIASIECSKDNFELLANAVMPEIKRQLIQLRNSSAFVVYSYRTPRKHRKVFILPQHLTAVSMTLSHNHLSYLEVGVNKTINLVPYFNMEDDDFLFQDLRVTKIISCFHDLYVGDLAFLSMSIGMNNSSGAHCTLCKKKAREFNCEAINPEDVRTKASLTQSLNEFNIRRLTSRGIRNVQGVNSIGLLDIDPQRIIVPILHTPMGLVDKVLEVFKAWTVFEVERLPDASEALRAAYIRAKEDHLDAVAFEEEARQLSISANQTAVLVALYHAAQTARANAKTEESKAKQVFDEMVKRHNAKVISLQQDYDTICRSHNIKKEHYHGGKCNGVNCIRIMEKAQELFEEFAAAIKEKKMHARSDTEIDGKCEQFARLLGLFDIIWSNVRGISAGLLPTEDQIQQLRKALSNAKKMWNNMEFKTLQPKWHLCFDGHLLHQVIKYGGLADKADDTIEFQHQTLMKLRDRHRSITSCQKRETCIRRELRRQRSPETQKHIRDYEAAIKRNPNSKRQLDFTERQQDQRDTKRIKREATLDG